MNALSSQIKFFIWEHPGCTFLSIAGDFDPSKRITCGEIWKAIDELRDEKEILIEGEGYNETFRIRPPEPESALQNTVQEITLYAFLQIEKKYPEKSRDNIFAIIRDWATEFEDYWWRLPLSKQESIGYHTAIESFCEDKLDGNPYKVVAKKIAHIFEDGVNLLEIDLPQQGHLYCSKIVVDNSASAVIHWGTSGDWHRALNIPSDEFSDYDRVAEALEWFDNQ